MDQSIILWSIVELNEHFPKFPPCSLSEFELELQPNLGRMAKSGKPKHNHSSNNHNSSDNLFSYNHKYYNNHSLNNLQLCAFFLVEQLVITVCLEFPYFCNLLSRICQFYSISPTMLFPLQVGLFVLSSDSLISSSDRGSQVSHKNK